MGCSKGKNKQYKYWYCVHEMLFGPYKTWIAQCLCIKIQELGHHKIERSVKYRKWRISQVSQKSSMKTQEQHDKKSIGRKKGDKNAFGNRIAFFISQQEDNEEDQLKGRDETKYVDNVDIQSDIPNEKWIITMS